MATPADAAAEAASLTKTLADMAKSIASLTSEFAKRPAATALEHLIGLPANPLAFPPSSNGKYPVLDTPTLHPHLSSDVVTQIGKFEFPPAQLGRLLKTFSAPPPAGLHLVVGPTGEALFVPPTPVIGATALLRELPDILTFVEAWMVFTSVLQNQQLQLPVAQALTAHLNIIIMVARAYPWPAVLDYHIAFMQARALDTFFNPINWMKSDPHLHTMHLLVPNILHPASPASGTSAAPPAPSTAELVRMAGQICYMYNTPAGCAGPSGCPRRHVCRMCSGPHSKEACRTAPSPAV
ncbi:hypothetical protein C8F04DRAFT_34389 [Mycena alexandri]|uniref:Uncharacterized protein n=1 Tax=Mycena alexandri TaxID=1745969 RepID=A0AAD6TD80_9AGAR|nr:hypothetical protein C8F04DRAFT_34389 [Mycena alexandri]